MDAQYVDVCLVFMKQDRLSLHIQIAYVGVWFPFLKNQDAESQSEKATGKSVAPTMIVSTSL